MDCLCSYYLDCLIASIQAYSDNPSLNTLKIHNSLGFFYLPNPNNVHILELV